MRRLLSIILAFIAYLGMGFSPTLVYADEQVSYTNVMEDLEKDESFNATDYLAIADDYSLEVIQIAESVDGELFIYVYQPSDAVKELTATSINISTAIDGNSNYANYDLTLISTSGVFDKYKVEGLSVKVDVLRFYGIISIYRAYDETIDGDSSGDNTTNEVAYNVGQVWTAATVNGSVVYAVEYCETITAESKHVGFIRYLDNYFFYNASTDSHYIAFSTHRKMDTLLEVEVGFEYKTSKLITNTSFAGLNSHTYGEAVKETVTLTAEQVFEDNNWFIGTDAYKYNRIQTVEEFIENESEDFTEETKAALKDKEWVLRFWETDYTSMTFATTPADSLIQNYQTVIDSTIVSNVVLFRLKFSYDGKIYDMGVVDNKTSGDTLPDNVNPGLPELPTIEGGVNWSILVAVVALCLLMPILYPLLSALIEFLIWVITAPFKAIGRAVKSRGNKNDEDD